MDFERRAKKAYRRGEPARAVVVLVEGLKRRPDREETARLLVDLYVEGVETPGLERDMVSALAVVPEGEVLAGHIERRLVESNRGAMARDFRRAAAEEGLALADAKAEDLKREERENRGGDDGSPDGAADESRDDEPAASAGETSESNSAAPEANPGPAESDADEVDDRAARETRGGANTSGAARTPPDTGESRSDSGRATSGSSSSSSRFRAGVGFALTLAVLLVAWGLGRGFTTGEASRLGEHLRSVDPSRPDALASLEQWADESGASRQVVREGRAFIDGLRALEAGERFEFRQKPKTPWGQSARSVAALTGGDYERAVRFARELRRVHRSSEVVGAWTNGRVAEARGELARAGRLYRRTLERSDEFAPAITGALRVAYARLDRKRVRELVERLRSLRSNHPYVRLGTIALPRFGPSNSDVSAADSEPEQGLQSGGEEAESEFLSAVETYAAARDAAASRRFDRSLKLSSRVLEVRSQFGPALWIEATSAAANFHLERADRAFGKLLELPRLARAYRWNLTVVAPRVLTGAGRPDLAAKYVLPGTGALETEVGGSVEDAGDVGTSSRGAGGTARDVERRGSEQTRLVAARTAKWTYDSSNPAVARSVVEQAHLERIRVALELGRLTRARRLFEGLPEFRTRGRALGLLRAEYDARRGRRPTGPTQWGWREASAEQRIVETFHSGRFDEAIELSEEMLGASGAPARIARFAALSYAATDRGRRALRLLSEREWLVRTTPEIRRVRERITARLAGGRARSRSKERHSWALEPTSVEAAVDLASVALWRHDLERASRWSRVAVSRAPSDPGANWVRGLVLRMRGRREASESYFRRSWRARDVRPRLPLQLGYVHLAEGNYRRARDLFYRALLADSGSLEAIRGLGRAYEGYDREEGRWNFERILENYQSKDARAVHAAEVLRWLAVFAGSREGESGAREFLDRARSRAGERPPLLLELGRYHRTRGELSKAKASYMEALEKDATLAPAHLGLAKIAGRRDNGRAQQSHLRRYLDLQPEGSEAEWARDELSRLRGSDAAAGR